MSTPETTSFITIQYPYKNLSIAQNPQTCVYCGIDKNIIVGSSILTIRTYLQSILT